MNITYSQEKNFDAKTLLDFFTVSGNPDAKYEEKEKEFKLAKKEFTTCRNKKDLQLDLFLFHANNANKASRINILDLA